MVEIYILKSENKIDGCQSFTHVSFLIETKEKNKENCYTVQLNKLDSHNDDFIAQVYSGVMWMLYVLMPPSVPISNV